jgi:hypothetical protein
MARSGDIKDMNFSITKDGFIMIFCQKQTDKLLVDCVKDYIDGVHVNNKDKVEKINSLNIEN